MSTTTAIAVPFHGADLFVIEHNGQPYTPMRPIVEGMGLDWKSQHAKLQENQSRWATMVISTIVAGDGKIREMLCLPLRKLAGWLMTIYPNKVKPQIRDTILKYQNECDDVLWQYWTEGQVVHPGRASAKQVSAFDYVKLIKEDLPNLGGTSLQQLYSDASEIDLGRRLLPLPKIEEEFFTATDLAQEFGITPQKLGKVASAGGLKTAEFGEYRLSKSKHSSKQVEQFYYNKKGRQALALMLAETGKAN